jgi:hypothetical protein
LRPAVARTSSPERSFRSLSSALVLLQGAAGSEHSQKALTSAYALQRAQRTHPLSISGIGPIRPSSTRGKAQRVTDIAAFEARLARHRHDLFAIARRDFDALPDADRQRLQLIDTFGDYRLLRETRR